MQQQEELSTYDKALEAVKFIQTKTDLKPTIGFILGSGLGDYADELEEAIYIPFEQIPYFKKSTVAGHKGNLVLGKKGGQTVICQQGRYHFYEGHHIKEVVFPVYVMKLLGIKYFIITNAAGGINRMLTPGDLMIIKDHINYMGTNPLIGPHDDRFGSVRFPDMTDVYCREVRLKIQNVMKQHGISVKQGTYMAFTGPSYETPAEIRMCDVLGADAVGMSTVPEAIVAKSLNLKIGGISCVCNMAAGIHHAPLDHKEVCETADEKKENFKNLLDGLLTSLV